MHPLLGTVPPPNYDLVTDMSTTASLLVNPLPSLSAGDKIRFGITSATTAEFDIHPHVKYIPGRRVPHAQITLLYTLPANALVLDFLRLAHDGIEGS
ncbi:hypothetical protein TSOC111612_10745 [Tsukamurella ocularis]